jgi:hypothetical protein
VALWMVGTELYQVGWGLEIPKASTIRLGSNGSLSHETDPPDAKVQSIEALIPPIWKRGMQL